MEAHTLVVAVVELLARAAAVVVPRVALVVSPVVVTTSSVQVGRVRDLHVVLVAVAQELRLVAEEAAETTTVTMRAVRMVEATMKI